MGLALLKLVQWISGFDEQQFFKRFPAGEYLIVILGIGFTAGIIYSVKKILDTHPNIQLRNQPADVLRQVLDDPDYASWHDEANRLLKKSERT